MFIVFVNNRDLMMDSRVGGGRAQVIHRLREYKYYYDGAEEAPYAICNDMANAAAAATRFAQLNPRYEVVIAEFKQSLKAKTAEVATKNYTAQGVLPT